MRFQDVPCKLGDVWHISNDLVTDHEEFTCAIYLSLLYFEAEVMTSVNFHHVERHCLGIVDK